jgi:hypothetical protein
MELSNSLPEDRSAKIWRYLDLPKFLYILDRCCLYLPRADRLGDPFEGSITPESISAFRGSLDDEYIDRTRRYTRTLREWSYISCWHLSEVESAALWRIYSQSPGGIAIQTRLDRLLEVVPETSVEHRGDYILSQDVTLVHYIDYSKSHPDINTSIGPLICKRESFRHENEVRAILQFISDKLSSDRPGGRAIDLSAPPGSDGKDLQIHVPTFIENVYVEPTCTDWFFDIVKNVIKRYGFDLPCHRSSLGTAPFF